MQPAASALGAKLTGTRTSTRLPGILVIVSSVRSTGAIVMASTVGWIVGAAINLLAAWYLHRIVLLCKHVECPTCRKLNDAERRLGG